MRALTYDELLLRLRKVLPALQARFGVQRIGIHGTAAILREEIVVPASKTISVVIETTEPLGTDFVVLRQQLEQLLKHPVHLDSLKLLSKSSARHIRFA